MCTTPPNFFLFQLTAILREVHYLRLMEQDNIPEEVLKLAEKGETFQQYISNLNSTVVWYNKIKKSSKNVEFDLIEDDLNKIDEMISTGRNELNWESQGIFGKKILHDTYIEYTKISNFHRLKPRNYFITSSF